LNNELIIQQFDQIERKVERLIEVCNSLEAANAELKGRIGQLEADLQQKVEAESGYIQEKDLIRSKIDGLLARLDSISQVQE
jgi:regulator of replication initiation timing